MKRTFGRLLAAAALAVFVQGAWAQTNPWYVALGFGPTFPNDSDSTQAGITFTTEFDTGPTVAAAFGRSFGNFRTEAEIGYGVNDVSAVGVAGVGSVSASGDVSTLAFMVNAFYDFSVGRWKPYIGGGVGAANLSLNNLSAVGFLLADDDQTVFAYQIMVGIASELSPSWEGTFGYRFFGTEDADFVDSTGTPFSSDGAQTHILELGIRYRF